MIFESIKKKSFTLIEVLVASSILFIVSAAVVGLSNSIIQGTSVTADSATANRLATEGLELITKIRDDKIKIASFETGKFIWFGPVESSAEYGWYTLDEFPANNWTLIPSPVYGDVIDTTSFNGAASENINNLGLVDYYRLICIEAVGAENDQKDNSINCNTVEDGAKTVNDGSRAAISVCFPYDNTGLNIRNVDVFCEFTEDSLNKNKVVANKFKLIPDGNSVKIRSVVLWNDRDVYRSTEIATILTNWQSFAQ